jgi:hypothetical protein
MELPSSLHPRTPAGCKLRLRIETFLRSVALRRTVTLVQARPAASEMLAGRAVQALPGWHGT